MTHDEAADVLEALALDALDASERAAVVAHVAGCVTCQAELLVLERAVSDLAYSVAPVLMSPAQRDRVRARLLTRATSGSARRMGAGGWLALAASAVAVLSLAGLMNARRQRDLLRESLTTAAAVSGSRAVALDSLRGVLGDRERLIGNLIGPRVALMSLVSRNPQSPSARMFWDQQHDAWTFVAHNLPAPAAGRSYQLWLVTPTAKISAGTFMPDASGDAMVRATYALPTDALAAVAVTDEPSAGSAQPTTAPFLTASR